MPYLDPQTGLSWTIFDDEQLVIDIAGVPQPNLTGQLYAIGGSTPLPIRELTSAAPLGGVTTTSQGRLPKFMALIPASAPQYRAQIDFPGDSVTAQIIKSDDLADAVAATQAAVVAAQSAASSASQARDTATNASVAAEASRLAAVAASQGSDGQALTLANSAYTLAQTAKTRADAAYALAEAGGGVVTPPPPPPTTGTAKTATPATIATVIAGAIPGDVITLTDGTYPKVVILSKSGTAAARITLQGSRLAVIDGGGTASGIGLHVDRSNYWTFAGFTVRRAQNGIVTDEAGNNIWDALEVHTIGNQGVQQRNRSSNNVFRNGLIHDCGSTNAGSGEGWSTGIPSASIFSTPPAAFVRFPGQVDSHSGNQVLNTRIWNTTSECVDVQEGASGFTVKDCTLEGQLVSGVASSDSYMDIKGNDGVIEDNVGINPSTFVVHGFETHIAFAGWGQRNVFKSNTVTLTGTTGFGFNIQTTGSQGAATGNIVETTNSVSPDPTTRLSNIATTNPDGTTTPPPGTGAASPAVFLNIGPGLNQFRLQLPIDTTHAVSPDRYTMAELVDGFTIDPWFKLNTAKTGVLLRARVDGARVVNSAYPRTQLQETDTTGDIAATWNPASGVHTFRIPTIAVMHVPPVQKHVHFMSVHSETGVDLASFTTAESAGQIAIVARINGVVQSPALVTNYTPGTSLSEFRIIVSSGGIQLFYADMVTPKFTTSTTLTAAHFRCGAWVLSNPTNETDPAEYGEVEFRAAPVITHGTGGTPAPSLSVYADVY